MNNPKALFQINNGTGWTTIAEAEIESYHGVVHNASTYDYVKRLHQQAREYVAELRKMIAESKQEPQS